MKTQEEIEKLASEKILSEKGQVGFSLGYNECQKDMADDYHNGYLQGLKDKDFELSDKKYTEGDLREAIKKAKKYFPEFPYGLKEGHEVKFVYNADEIVESINVKK